MLLLPNWAESVPGSSQAIVTAPVNVLVRSRHTVSGPMFNSFHRGYRRDSEHLAQPYHLGKGSGSALPSARGSEAPYFIPVLLL